MHINCTHHRLKTSKRQGDAEPINVNIFVVVTLCPSGYSYILPLDLKSRTWEFETPSAGSNRIGVPFLLELGSKSLRHQRWCRKGLGSVWQPTSTMVFRLRIQV
ncbi:hypothetical protein CROQUDRAFT_89605 [Cronartium quercuum f. sp. fusiforme G11]|uniref:Uncharacterized protein n=1 Tax=Cronartium quercuum f. sp. fusiforme G11 TaxID=708437 RepID=A0A9P6TFR8_9BASI|nr:hypothetical protein CROQUDRAFT_89605 [Cronartium quercuum f. sp. fusiforme G11]